MPLLQGCITFCGVFGFASRGGLVDWGGSGAFRGWDCGGCLDALCLRCVMVAGGLPVRWMDGWVVGWVR